MGTKAGKSVYLSLYAAIIAIFHFCISFYTDRLQFASVAYENRYFYIFDKIIYLMLLFLVWSFLFLAVYEKKNNGFAWRMLKNSLPFLFLYIACAVMVYPAVEFGGDMPFFITPAKEYRLNGGLHWISTLVYVIGYMMFPIDGGVTILMALLSALTYGYIWTKATEIGVKKRYLGLLFLPPYVIYSIYPTRLTMMTLAFEIYFVLLYSAYVRRETLTKRRLVILLVFTGMLSVWRMEGKYLLLFAPLFFILAYRKKVHIKRYIQYFLLCMIAYIIFSVPDHSRNITLTDRLHPIVGYMIPLMEMDGFNWKDCEEYDVINGYIDMEALKEKEQSYGLELYRADYLAALGVIRSEFKSAKSEYVWAAVKACLKNPAEYFKIRIKVLALALNGSEFPFTGSINDENNQEDIPRWFCLFLINGYRATFSDPVTDGCWTVLWRKFVIWTKNIVWQLWTSAIMMIWMLFDTVKKKNWFCFAYTLGLWCYSGIVFLFCPGIVFKYYWPIYTYCVLYFILCIKRGTEQKDLLES